MFYLSHVTVQHFSTLQTVWTWTVKFLRWSWRIGPGLSLKVDLDLKKGFVKEPIFNFFYHLNNSFIQIVNKLKAFSVFFDVPDWK